MLLLNAANRHLGVGLMLFPSVGCPEQYPSVRS